MTTIEFDASDLIEELEKILGRAYNPQAINEQVAEVIKGFVDDKFEDEGPGWAPLAEDTIRLRRASANPTILQDTGVLAGTIDTAAGVDFAEVFTNVRYATFHLEGTEHMEDRDFFDIDFDAALGLAADIIVDDIAR